MEKMSKSISMPIVSVLKKKSKNTQGNPTTSKGKLSFF
jgi:hypothetical protein